LPNAYDLTVVERIAGKTAADEPILKLSAKRQAAHQEREEREVIALVGERSGCLQQLQIVIEFRGPPPPPLGSFPKWPGRRGEREHEDREREEGKEHETRERGLRPRRGSPQGSKEPRYHTLTFRYSEDVQLSTQEYAPPK